MKCQVSVGVKLRRRALVLPQDGEQQGVKASRETNHDFVLQRRLLRDLWSFEHACKEPASALCSSGGGRSQVQSVGVAEMEMRYCVRVGGWDRRVFDAGGGSSGAVSW